MLLPSPVTDRPPEVPVLKRLIPTFAPPFDETLWKVRPLAPIVVFWMLTAVPVVLSTVVRHPARQHLDRPATSGIEAGAARCVDVQSAAELNRVPRVRRQVHRRGRTRVRRDRSREARRSSRVAVYQYPGAPTAAAHRPRDRHRPRCPIRHLDGAVARCLRDTRRHRHVARATEDVQPIPARIVARADASAVNAHRPGHVRDVHPVARRPVDVDTGEGHAPPAAAREVESEAAAIDTRRPLEVEDPTTVGDRDPMARRAVYVGDPRHRE